MKVLIADPLDESALAAFRQREIEPVVATGLSEDELVEKIGEFEALVVRSATKVTRRIVEAGERLVVIGRAGVGVDNVDCEAATERGVVVMNAPDGNTRTTAELAIALLVSLARHVPQAAGRTRAGTWSKKGLMGTELLGKTLGVVGLGRIGRSVAELGRGLGLEIVAHDPFVDSSNAPPDVELGTLDEVIARADFLTLHVPLSNATRNLLSAERIAKLKRGAYLINAARGGLVDEGALAAALEAGRVAGAALDVLAEEPPSPEHPLLGRDDVIVTPHLGASSTEAQVQVAHDIAHQIADFLTDGVPRNAVNAPAVSAETLRELGPYMRLAEKIGSFLTQRSKGALRTIEISLAGQITESDPSHLRLAVLVGVLKSGLAEGVNFVNAPQLAKDRGLRVFESTDEDSGTFTSRIKVRVFTRGGEETHVVAGTVFGRQPRFVRIDDVHADIAPDGPWLVTSHVDEPGVIGKIGTLLGEAGVNVRRVELGPPKPGTEHELASGFFALYEPPPAEVIEQVQELGPIREAQLILL